MMRRLHMIESGGRGGVFNHSVEVVAGLQELGVDVVLHTATDSDATPAGLSLCRCITWHRTSANRLVRQVRTSASYLVRTLPHLFRVIDRRDVVHIQGMFAFTPELIRVARLRCATVVCSPHNTFLRANAPGGARALKSALSRSDRVLVYSDADVARLAPRLSEVGRVPLVQWTPSVRPALVARWRELLNPDGVRLALMPGQVRADKHPEIFVQALASLPGWRGAIVGDDLGPGPELDRLIAETGAPVTTSYGYLDVDNFVALVAAADVVVAPYGVASQSGVLAVAARLGVPTAVAPVGGLSELATAVARDNTASAIREAMIAAADAGAKPVDSGEAAKLFLAEYLVAHNRRQNNRHRGVR